MKNPFFQVDVADIHDTQQNLQRNLRYDFRIIDNDTGEIIAKFNDSDSNVVIDGFCRYQRQQERIVNNFINF